MTCRVILVAPAITPSLRRARFDDGDSIERPGAVALSLPAAGGEVSSPSVRCRETAAALGLDASVEPELSGLDAGRWRGRTLEEVGTAEPEALLQWLTDPGAAPHGGESVRELCARVTGWLDRTGRSAGRTIAVVEPEVVRAVLLHALGAPESAFWRVDVPPLSATEIAGGPGRWNLRLGQAGG
ncbi:histidine phosphatase family protein [Streptomyces sp900105755]|uniref:histidine phosphatase family protein n=1 Tax=unclassified Streptomyces TaxID=2593676 RepID=UPI000898F3BF|nr:histidine phosphatase family protein [Streptomyces sp. Ag109_O5-10]SEE44735.1 Histidine phosphatase superfamily (branch 1) [Streptomyces sp. Ag109_O5-10]